MWKLRRHAQDPIKVPEEDKHFLIHFDGPLSPWELLGRLRVLEREVPKFFLRSFRGGRFLPARRTHSVLLPLRIRTLAGHLQRFVAPSSFKGLRTGPPSPACCSFAGLDVIGSLDEKMSRQGRHLMPRAGCSSRRRSQKMSRPGLRFSSNLRTWHAQKCHRQMGEEGGRKGLLARSMDGKMSPNLTL